MSEINLSIKYKTYPLRLIFYAVFFSLMLFLLLPFSRMFQDYSKNEKVVRSIELATTPPPPPRKQEQQQDETLEDIVNIETVRSEIEIEPLNIQLETSLEGELKVKIGVGEFNIRQGKTNLLTDIKMFSLVELDNTPVSLNNPLLRMPSSLAESGVKEINAEALVILTEEGKVEFIQFISLSHQDANEAIKEYILKLRYSPPTKDGEVGRVRFRLPIRIKE